MNRCCVGAAWMARAGWQQGDSCLKFEIFLFSFCLGKSRETERLSCSDQSHVYVSCMLTFGDVHVGNSETTTLSDVVSVCLITILDLIGPNLRPTIPSTFQSGLFFPILILSQALCVGTLFSHVTCLSLPMIHSN